MQPKQCIAIIDSIKAYAKQNPTEAQVYEDWFQAVVNLRDALPQDKRFDAYKYSGELRSVCAAMMGKMKTGEDVAKVYDIISRTYLFEARMCLTAIASTLNGTVRRRRSSISHAERCF